MALVQVIGLVGSSRKRTLMLWQAVELSRMMDRPNLATLQIARKALEPPDDPIEQVCCALAYPAMLRCAVLCCAVLCCAVLCCAVLCCAVPCRAMLRCAALCCMMSYSAAPARAVPCLGISTLQVCLASLECACTSAIYTSSRLLWTRSKIGWGQLPGSLLPFLLCRI